MRTLAIDPASTVLGWAVIDYDVDEAAWVDFGQIDVRGVAYERRPSAITGHMEQLHMKYKPHELAIEQVFRSPKYRVDELGVAFKSIKKWAVRHKMEVFLYAPPTWKAAVIGNGLASKAQVMAVVELLRNDYPVTNEGPLGEHAADALAIGEYHVRMRRFVLLAQGQAEELAKRLGQKP